MSQNGMNEPLIDDVNPYQQAKQNPQSYDQPVYDKPAEQDIRASFSADANPLLQQRSKIHGRSLVSTMFLLAGVITPLVMSLTQPGSIEVGAAIGIAVGSYLFYLMLSMCCNDLFKYLSNIEHGTRFEAEYNKVRTIIGYFRFNATCYHYETRHHTRHVTDSNGNSRTQHYTTTEKVITHRATQNLCPRNTKDESGQPDQIESDTNIVFIEHRVNYRFIDDFSRNKFDQEYCRFRIRHTRDAHQDFNYQYILPDLKDKQAFYVGELHCNMLGWLIFFGFLGLIWPYSLWVESKIKRFSIEFIKTLTM